MSDNEKEIEQLRKFSYSIAMNMIKNHDDAEDIAQNTLIQFINSEDIKNAEAWTKKVTQNLVFDKFRDNKKTSNITNAVKHTFTSDLPLEVTQDCEIEQYSYKQISRHLTKEDKLLYSKYSKCKFSIKAFAEKYDLNYNTASSKIKALKKNMKAMYLYEKGVNNTSILYKKEWSSLYMMIKRKFVNNENAPFPIDHLISFCYVKSTNYQSVLVIGKKESIPVFFVVDFKFGKSRISILDIKLPALVRVINDNEKAEILQRLKN